MNRVFLHGLDSSSKGTKASWFRKKFPDMMIPDFSGTLSERMDKLGKLLSGRQDLLLVGSSFGGLMAAIYALENPDRVNKLIMLAPALNFVEFVNYRGMTAQIQAVLYIGIHDEVCPPDVVITAAREAFPSIEVNEADDDHLLRKVFERISWDMILK